MWNIMGFLFEYSKRQRRWFRNIVRIQTHKKLTLVKKSYNILKNIKIFKKTWENDNNKKCNSLRNSMNRLKLFKCFYALDTNLYNKVYPYKRRIIKEKKKMAFFGWRLVKDVSIYHQKLITNFHYARFRRFF